MVSALSLWLIMQAATEPSVADARREAIVLMNRGVDAHLLGEKFELVERSLREASSRDPSYEAPYINLARLYAYYLRWADADLAYEQALQLAPADQRAQLHHEHGSSIEAMVEWSELSADERRGHFERAAEIFGLAVSADPRDYRSHHRHAVLQDQLGDFHAADASWRRCIEIQPGHAPCFVGLAHMYIDFGFGNVATAVLEIGTKVNDSDAHMWLGAAEGYLELELWQQAADSARKAITIESDLTDAYFFLGMATTELGDHELAIEQLSSYLERLPDQADQTPWQPRQIAAYKMRKLLQTR
jgi:tetratricopeptide (TPR) repeat protein